MRLRSAVAGVTVLAALALVARDALSTRAESVAEYQPRANEFPVPAAADPVPADRTGPPADPPPQPASRPDEPPPGDCPSYWAAFDGAGKWEATPEGAQGDFLYPVTRRYRANCAPEAVPPMLSRDALVDCLQGKTVVVAGDSLARQQFGVLAELLSGEPDADFSLKTEIEYLGGGATRTKPLPERTYRQCHGPPKYLLNGACRPYRRHDAGDPVFSHGLCADMPRVGRDTELCMLGWPPREYDAGAALARLRAVDLVLVGFGLHQMQPRRHESFVGFAQAVNDTVELLDELAPRALKVFLGLHWRFHGKRAGVDDKYWAYQNNDIARKFMAAARRRIGAAGGRWRFLDQWHLTRGQGARMDTRDGTHVSWNINVAKVMSVLGGYCGG